MVTAVSGSTSQEQRLIPLLGSPRGERPHATSRASGKSARRVRKVLRGKAGSEAVGIAPVFGATKPQRPFFSRAMTTV